MFILIPDFRDWSFKFREYFYYDTEIKEFLIDENLVDLKPKSYFIAVINNYELNESLDSGCSLNVFNLGERIKFWGREGNIWRYWSVLKEGQWRTFLFKDYASYITPLFTMKIPKEVGGIRIHAMDRNSQKVFLSVDILNPPV